MISISFEVQVYTNFGQSVYLVGNHLDLGDWMPNLGFELTTSPERYPIWSSIKDLRLPEGYDLEFKIVVMNSCYQLSRWEGLFQNRQYTTSARCDQVTLKFQEGNPWMQEIFPNNNLNEKTVSIKDYARILTPLKIQQFSLLNSRNGQDDLDKQTQLLRETLYEFNSEIVQETNQDSQDSSLRNITSSSQPELSGNPSKLKDHFYSAEALNNKSVLLATTQKKFQRLKSELKQLNKSLPVQGSNSIFLVYDEQRMDILRAIIFGAEGTPYAHGAFIFDIFAPDEYPSVPPKIALISTKGGQIRFGPNLYESGSVCLSLIGTWRGDSAESWNPATSNLYQVLISIQSLVMNEDVFFNEPYYDTEKGTPYGEECNRAYCNIVKFWNLSHAINDAIEQPPVEFQKVILIHFYLQRESIRQMIESWIQDADQPCQYDDLIFDHNAKIATKFSNDPLEYKKLLKEEQIRFEQLIENLQERVKDYINVL